MTVVRQTAGHGRDQRAGQPGKAEQSDRGGADEHPLAEQRLTADKPDDRAQQLQVAQPLGRGDARKRQAQDGGEQHHHDARDDEDHAPSEQLGDDAADDAGREDADQQSAHHGADDSPALVLAGER